MKKLLAGVAVLTWAGVLTACLAADESETTENEDGEEVGQAQQEVGEGGQCGPSYGTCSPSPPLACCGGVFVGRCRNLQNDEANCGQCGNNCYDDEPPYPYDGWTCIAGNCVPT